MQRGTPKRVVVFVLSLCTGNLTLIPELQSRIADISYLILALPRFLIFEGSFEIPCTRVHFALYA